MGKTITWAGEFLEENNEFRGVKTVDQWVKGVYFTELVLYIKLKKDPESYVYHEAANSCIGKQKITSLAFSLATKAKIADLAILLNQKEYNVKKNIASPEVEAIHLYFDTGDTTVYATLLSNSKEYVEEFFFSSSHKAWERKLMQRLKGMLLLKIYGAKIQK